MKLLNLLKARKLKLDPGYEKYWLPPGYEDLLPKPALPRINAKI